MGETTNIVFLVPDWACTPILSVGQLPAISHITFAFEAAMLDLCCHEQATKPQLV